MELTVVLRSEILAKHPSWVIKPMADMEDLVNCATCGKVITFGSGYTSHYQTTDGDLFGLPVCVDCYAAELKKLGSEEWKDNG